MAKIVTDKYGVSKSTATPKTGITVKSGVSGVSVGEIKGSQKPAATAPVATATKTTTTTVAKPNYQSVNGKIVDVNKTPAPPPEKKSFVIGSADDPAVQSGSMKQNPEGDAALGLIQEGFDKTKETADKYGIGKVYSSIDEQVADTIAANKEKSDLQKKVLEEQSAANKFATKNQINNISSSADTAASALRGSREGFSSESNIVAGKNIKASANAQIQRLQSARDTAQAQIEQAQRDLERANTEGNTELAQSLSNTIAAAELKVQETEAQIAESQQKGMEGAVSLLKDLSNAGALAGLSDDDIAYLQEQLPDAPPGVIQLLSRANTQKSTADAAKAKLDAAVTGIDTLGKIFDSGSQMSLDQVLSLSGSLGISKEDAIGLYQSREATRNDKSLTEEEKQIKNATDLDNYKRRARGAVNSDLEKVDYINSLYASGASQSQIEEVKRIMGVTTDAVYELELQKKSLDNEAISILNQFLPAEKIQALTKGELDITGKEFDNIIKEAEANGASETQVLNLQKLRIEARQKEIEYNEVAGVANLPDDDMKSVFYQKGPSDYGHGEGLRECGEGYNDITDGPKVGNSYATKMKTVTKRDNPQVGNGLMLPLAYNGLVKNNSSEPGHIETVIESNPITGQIKTVSWNRDGHGKQTIETYTVAELNKRYGNNWGFNDAKLKPEYETKLSSQKAAVVQSKGKLPNVTDQEILEAYNKSGKVFTTVEEQKEAIKAARSGGFLPEKPAAPRTDAQRASEGFYNRMNETENIFDTIAPNIESMDVIEFSKQKLLPNWMKTPVMQQQEQAQRDFINAKLRKESGAAISPSEFDSAALQYFPQPGDSKEVLAQKKKNRQTVIDGMKNEAALGADAQVDAGGGWAAVAKGVYEIFKPKPKLTPDPLNIGMGGDPLGLGLQSQ